MNVKKLQNYTSFTNLTSELLYLHTTLDIYTQDFDNQGKNSIHFFYDLETKTYNFYFKLLDQKVADSFIKLKNETEFSELKNKEEFLLVLKDKIGSLISVMQKNGYKFIHDPEVDLNDLEHLDEILWLDTNESFDDFEQEDNSKTKRHNLNKILLYHDIMSHTLEREPYEKNWVMKIRVNSIDYNVINFFPSHNDKFREISVNISWVPNVYFPWLISLKIVKQFEFKEQTYQIIYHSQSLIQQIWKTAKQYYFKFRKARNPNPELLSFSTKLVEIIKNPYSSLHLEKWITKDQIIDWSQCSKCWSKSSLFNVTLWWVSIKTTMWMYEEATLYTDNIVTYKEILWIQCIECWNHLVNDKLRLEQVKEKRKKIWSEDWTSALHQTPILDEVHSREVIVHYDIMTLEVEFDLTNPLLPELNYNQILSTWRIIWWTEPENWQYKDFYKLDM